MIRYEVGVTFFPHRDDEDFAVKVCLLNIKYLDKIYHFAINGQTGKVVGEYPVDKGKKWKYFWKVAGIGYAVAAVIAFLMLR